MGTTYKGKPLIGKAGMFLLLPIILSLARFGTESHRTGLSHFKLKRTQTHHHNAPALCTIDTNVTLQYYMPAMEPQTRNSACTELTVVMAGNTTFALEARKCCARPLETPESRDTLLRCICSCSCVVSAAAALPSSYEADRHKSPAARLATRHAAVCCNIISSSECCNAESLAPAAGNSRIWALDESIQNVSALCQKTLGACDPSELRRATAEEALRLQGWAAKLKEHHGRAGPGH